MKNSATNQATDSTTTGPTKTAHVIELTISGHVAYLAKDKAEWDGCWFTRKVENAKPYKLVRNAEKRIKEMGSTWGDMDARVVDMTDLVSK